MTNKSNRRRSLGPAIIIIIGIVILVRNWLIGIYFASPPSDVPVNRNWWALWPLIIIIIGIYMIFRHRTNYRED